MTLFGPSLGENNATFRLWAPDAEEVELLRPETDPLTMERDASGFFHLTLPGAPLGMKYMFRVDGVDVPDPASRRQAEDVHGWSLLEPPLLSGSQEVRRPWHEAVIAEVHVGAASPEGTFKGLQKRLEHFVEAGYTVIELMPVADFPGARNWGYDGVLPFAPDRSYGSPEDLRGLVDAAHGLGLGIMLDVVYNHFGPDGNFLPHYASAFFKPTLETPWGPAIDLANPTVRRFFLENAAMWLGEYDFDGLRFDAVHAFATEGADIFLAELAAIARDVKPDAYLVLENDNNAARWLSRDQAARPVHYTAQWNDDIHHSLHVLATRESAGYYRDYTTDPVAALARALSQGFAYQGEASAHRGGIPRGEPSAELSPEAFVAYTQNHDQIGNRPLGDRLTSSLSPERLALLRFALCLSPQIPLLFMGDEVGTKTPFAFFCDFDGDLAEAVRNGRKDEFADFFRNHGGTPDDLPDPLSPATFESAKLPWDHFQEPVAQENLRAFRDLIDLRRTCVWPLLDSVYQDAELLRHDEAILVQWRFSGGRMALALNPSEGEQMLHSRMEEPQATVGHAERREDAVFLGPWSGAFWQESA